MRDARRIAIYNNGIKDHTPTQASSANAIPSRWLERCSGAVEDSIQLGSLCW